MYNFQLRRSYFILLISYFILSSCSIQQKISKSAKQIVLSDSSLATAHVGISIYDTETGKYWYNYQGDKYFVPASNTKIPTCYAAMKYLGDSLIGLQYQLFSDTAINILPTGDPTFLHPDFRSQPVLLFLRKARSIYFSSKNWQSEALGNGWAWNDYEAAYMAERSAFPVFGNTVRIKTGQYSLEPINQSRYQLKPDWQVTPSYFKKSLDSIRILPLHLYARRDVQDTAVQKKLLREFAINRDLGGNIFRINQANSIFNAIEIPFFTDRSKTSLEILNNEYRLTLREGQLSDNSLYGEIPEHLKWRKLHSQPTDSLLKPMMHRSDNFFAEQSLLMVSNELLGVMNDAKTIDTILKTDFKDLPQRPRWADGSGLSRYNLFTPQDFVTILNKMKNEFGMERIKLIFPTGGEGTISNYYKADSNYIFAKTGTLSGVVAFSGFLYTKKGKLLIFSTLVNNHQASATAVRRSIERFLRELRSRN